MRIADVTRELFRNPFGLVRTWNWKSAMFSAITRAALFFGTTVSAGMKGALVATAAEALFRCGVAGFQGTVLQSYRRAEPAWASLAVVMMVVPAIVHLLEFGLHWALGTPNLRTSIVASVGVTLLAALFNWFAMRRGVLMVGVDGSSLREDFRRMPAIVGEFLVAGPLALWRLATRALHEWE